MDKILKKMVANEKENKFEENLFVKNIIVNKHKGEVIKLPYISTERWLEQLGDRLETSY